ncbi:carbohydrate ABC transporter permease [Clostridium sp. SYSU_GA19001]|uniref:carbohydrate ABC transporter permease n=1 Tax=Clostridium caldaquaticum TaxID=2940653 RepID=UPI0020777EAF|nr:carbohydrate ABC transporter permease [Clostridium caldaquaticum]MCM8711892.1 carbohydrate ABC transporter permease [Clostridium caldaquaticum]
MNKCNAYKKILVHSGIVLFLLINLLPIIIVLSSSLRSASNMTNPLNLFNEFTFESYKTAFIRMRFGTAFMNSLIITVISVVAIVIIAPMAAYPLARINNKLSKFLYLFFLGGLVVPGQMAVLPVVQMIKSLRIPSGQYTPIIMFITCSLPFSVFLYTGFIKSSVPQEVEEAAYLDGCGAFYRFWKIVFPLLLPATVSVVITQAIWIWNDYFFNMIFITKSSQTPLPLAMLGFMGDKENPTQWNTLFAACVLCALPLIAAFSVLQKYFMEGIAAGSVKG